MKKFNPGTLFPDYTQLRSPLSDRIWLLLRLVTLCVWIGMGALIYHDEVFGLNVLWGLVVPSVPLLLVIAPGLWRQICPMAFANQLPSMLKVSRGASLPKRLADWAFVTAVTIFIACVALRHPLFNHVGWATATILLLPLPFAFLGGWLVKGRAGWCGTFCPLGPIQRNYGQAPIINVRQTYCPTCIGCQKNCYDYNPKAAIFQSLDDEDPRYAAQYRFFMGLLPGLILGYFLQPDNHVQLALSLGVLAASLLISAGLHQALTGVFGLDAIRVSLGFSGASLTLFYWFSGPRIVQTASNLFDVDPNPSVLTVSRLIGMIAALTLLVQGWRNSRLVRRAREAAEAEALRKAGHLIVCDDLRRSFTVRPGQSLREAMVAAGLPIGGSCKAGLCGADTIYVTSGLETLPPPSSDEAATLARLGRAAGARLACSVFPLGPLTIRLTPAETKAKSASRTRKVETAAPPAWTSPFEDTSDAALREGFRRVVIIGNGVAGLTAADELRRRSARADILLVSIEPFLPYNRMAIGKIAEGHKGVDDLMLQSPDWYEQQRIGLRLSSRVEAIDPRAQRLSLMDGESLAYDRLLIATGARARLPDRGFLAQRNCFVLRTASDATIIHRFIRTERARSCVVIGDGVLAVETAEGLQRSGVAVTMLMREKRPLGAVADEDAASRLARYLENLGVKLIPEAQVSGALGRGRRQAMVLHSGEAVPADLFIACIGAQPELTLGTQAGLRVAQGLIVDDDMKTSGPYIWAAGDVAEFRGTVSGLWPFAVAQARAAAASMAGISGAYLPPPRFTRLKSEGIDFRYYGRMDTQPGDETILAEPFARAWWRAIVRDGAVTGAVYAGPPNEPNPLFRGNVPDLARIRLAQRQEDRASALL